MSQDPPPVERKFGIPALAYDKAPNKQNYIRVSMFFNKKPGVSYEFFQNHWHHVHADLVTSSTAFKKAGILRYNQFHQTPEGRAMNARLKCKCHG
jgi:hypothetical protein